MAGFDADSPNVTNDKQQSNIVFIVYNYDPRFFLVYAIMIIWMMMMMAMIITDSDKVDNSNKR